MVETEIKTNIPEMSVDGVEFLFSVGGDDTRKIHHHGYLKKIGSIIKKRELWGLSFITSLRMLEVRLRELGSASWKKA